MYDISQVLQDFKKKRENSKNVYEYYFRIILVSMIAIKVKEAEEKKEYTHR